jgi:hypothetical protein
MKQMNCAMHRRGSDHLLPLDPDEYRWPPQRFQTQLAKLRLERQSSKVGDHHFTGAHLQFELSDPLQTRLARYKLVNPAEDRCGFRSRSAGRERRPKIWPRSTTFRGSKWVSHNASTTSMRGMYQPAPRD